MSFSPFGGAPFGAPLGVGAGAPSFSIWPNAGHTAGAITINVTYAGGASAPASGAVPLSIDSGGGSVSAGTWVQDSGTTGHFTFNEPAPSGTPTVFLDSVTSTTQNFNNAVVVPGQPTIGTAVDAGGGVVTVPFTAHADNGGAAVTAANATGSLGDNGSSGGSSPISVTIAPANYGFSQTWTVTQTNSAGPSIASNASNAVAASGANYWTDPFANFNNFRNITNTFAVSSGRAVPQNAGLCVAIWDKLHDHVAHGPDYSVSGKIYKQTTAGAYNGLIGRYHKIIGDNYYLAIVRTSAGTDTIELYAVVEGTPNTIGTDATEEWTDGDTLTLEMVGNAIRVLRNGTPKITHTDTVYTSFPNIVGQAGLRSSGGTVGGVDDFSVAGVGTSVIHHTSGGVTGSTAKIAFSLSAAGTVKVEYSTNSNMSSSLMTSGTAVDSSTNYTGSITLTGLTAATQYYYRILVNDVIKQFTPFAKTKTVASAAGTVKIGLASCARLFDFYLDGSPSGLAENSKVFTHLVTAAPDVFLFNGDIGYADERPTTGASTLAHFRERNRQIQSAWTRPKSLADLRRAIPSVFNWDNHETLNGVYSSVGAQAYDEYYGTANPTPYRAGVRYYTFRVRDVEVFVTDGITFSSDPGAIDNSSKTKLGTVQKQDLKDWLYTSTAAIKIVVSATSVDPWGQPFTGDRSWGVGFKNELHQIWDFIQAQRISGVMWVSGDNHYSALFTTVRNGRTNYSLCASAANNGNITIPAGGNVGAERIFYDGTHQQMFGLMTINTSAGPPTLQLDIIDDTNAVIATSTITSTNLNNNLSAAALPDTPAAPTAAVLSPTSVRVTGAIPLNNGAAITQIRAISTPGSSTGTDTSGVQFGTYTVDVTGLTPGQAYTFTTRATNSVENSAESAASNSVTPTEAATEPDAPTIGTATGGIRSAQVSYTAPAANGGAPITQYRAISTPGSYTGTLNQAGSGTITVNGLIGGQFTFTVRAKNAVGNSVESGSSDPVTVEEEPASTSVATTTAGSALAVAIAVPATYDAVGYGALEYTAIGEITDLGRDYGRDYSTVTRAPIDSAQVKQRKSYHMLPTIEMLMAWGQSDAGQSLLRTAANDRITAAFKLTIQDGDIRYFTAEVARFSEDHGTVNDMRQGALTLLLQADIVAYTE